MKYICKHCHSFFSQTDAYVLKKICPYCDAEMEEYSDQGNYELEKMVKDIMNFSPKQILQEIESISDFKIRVIKRKYFFEAINLLSITDY